MADKFYDSLNPLPSAGTNARLELAKDDTVFIGLAVWNANGLAIQATDPTQIQIGTAGIVRGTTGALEIIADGTGTSTAPNFYSIYNDGSISATAGYGIKLTESGTTKTGALNLFNAGSINTSDIAVQGGSEGDRIVNTGVIRTTGTGPAIQLGAGNDFYDGSSGLAIGKIDLGTGNDTAYGGTSSDFFSGGDGDDYIDGSGGIDTADYSTATSNVTIDLRTTTWQETGQGKDCLLNIENLTGGDKHDSLIGNASDNVLTGGAGNDVLDGGSGSDTLFGGADNDTLDGGAGDDFIDGGDGVDTVRYSGYSAVTVTLASTGSQNTIGYGNDILKNIENVDGGSGADSITGNDGANKLTGNGGNDTLQGGKGNDTMEGGSGSNMAVFVGKKEDYTWTTTPDSEGYITITHKNGAGDDGVDKLKDIRIFKFQNDTSTSDDDVVIALSNSNPSDIVLSKSTVAENTAPSTTVATLSGTDPDGDQLTYELIGNAGGLFSLSTTNGTTNLVLNGPLDYETATTHVITVKAKDAYGGELVKNLTITVTNVFESNPVVRYGTAAGEQVVGEYGNDRVYGLGGDDQVFGQAGNDTLYGGAGSDTLIGGDGQDVFVFDAAPNVNNNLDRVYDFNPADDTIWLPRAIFTKIGNLGVLKKGAFVVGNAFKQKDDRIVYVKTAGALFYDADGSAKKYKPVQIATIEKNLALTNDDFFIV